jgi:hypothetical protein
MTAFARRIVTQRRCDCGESAEYAYGVLILGKLDTLYLCPHCLIHELEMQLEQCERKAGKEGEPASVSELSAVIRRYIKLEQTNLRSTPRQRDANVDQARRVLSRLRELELPI